MGFGDKSVLVLRRGRKKQGMLHINMTGFLILEKEGEQ